MNIPEEVLDFFRDLQVIILVNLAWCCRLILMRLARDLLSRIKKRSSFQNVITIWKSLFHVFLVLLLTIPKIPNIMRACLTVGIGR